jgi:hypothetical protein
MIRLTAAVSHDATNGGVSWTVSCAAAECGSVAPTTTPSGAATTYTPPAAIAGDIRVTIKATSVADKSKAGAATLIPVGYIPGYEVSVDYHSFGADIDQTGFIGVYDQPQVRQKVQAQLQAMADRGATSIQTAMWVEKGPDFPNTNVGVSFPMTDQEQANLRAYARDVASVVSASGQRLRLYIALNWLFIANFMIGSPTTTFGTDNLSPEDFTSRAQTTTDKIVAAVGDVTRPDGVKVVDTIFFVAEATLPDAMTPPGPVTNSGWFMTTNYPHFVTVVTPTGIRPSVYFNGGDGCTQSTTLDDTYVDALFPVLNGHRSMFFPYRGLKFMIDNGLPIPTGRVDFDCYLSSTGASYDQLLQRVLDDADATLPSLGAPKFYNIPETFYLLDPDQRFQYGQAFANQAAQSSRLTRVSFWTWPDSGGLGQEATYPFTIEDFLPLP